MEIKLFRVNEKRSLIRRLPPYFSGLFGKGRQILRLMWAVAMHLGLRNEIFGRAADCVCEQIELFE